MGMVALKKGTVDTLPWAGHVHSKGLDKNQYTSFQPIPC